MLEHIKNNGGRGVRGRCQFTKHTRITVGLRWQFTKSPNCQRPLASRPQFRQPMLHRDVQKLEVDSIIFVAEHVPEASHRMKRQSGRDLLHAWLAEADHRLADPLQASLRVTVTVY